jgi:hypothetical protein
MEIFYPVCIMAVWFIFVAIWHIFPILVRFTENNLATLMYESTQLLVVSRVPCSFRWQTLKWSTIHFLLAPRKKKTFKNNYKHD